jgi:hypothetical protein
VSVGQYSYPKNVGLLEQGCGLLAHTLYPVSCSAHKLENFLARFDYPKQCDTMLHAGSFYVGSSPFFIHPWHLESYTRPTSWPFHVKIYIERLLLHALSAEGVRQVLGDICIFNHMEVETFGRENTQMFCFFMWMKNPDLLPRSKTVSFFSEGSSRSNGSDGPLPVEAALASPPSGGDIDLLIHLDHYYDWSPQPKRSPNSNVSGMLASSSEASSGRLRPVYQCFTWYSGVVDGQVLGRPSGPRLIDSCCRPPNRDHYDDEPEDNGRGHACRD